MTAPPEFTHLADWIGRTEARSEHLGASAAAALAATLDRDDPEPLPGSDLPPLWHWVYFTPQTRASEIGEDGHAKRGGFLPPVALPRRMWAGGRLQFHHPLRIGDEVGRLSRITDVSVKQGRSGTLVFVTVRHELTNAHGVAVTEDQDLVYRDMPAPDQATPPQQAAPAEPLFTREIAPDPVLLFRYSALTFNGHRIHYDRPFATAVEGYPGLVVHGPLIATLLLDLLHRERPQARVRRYSYKSTRPLFDTQRFRVCARPEGTGRWLLWAQDTDGALAMQALAELD